MFLQTAAELSESQAQCYSLESSGKELNDRLNALQQKHDKLQRELKDCTEKLEQMEEEKDEVEKQLHIAQDTLTDTTSMLQRVSHKRCH